MNSGRRGPSGPRGMLPLLALQVVSEYYRLERKPPVTAGLIAANTLIYWRPQFLDSMLPTIDEVFFNSHLIIKHKDLKRLLLSAFYHIGDSHLVYNMLSLLWKGIQLETSMGSANFAAMVATLLGMSQGITLVLAKSLVHFLNYRSAYYNEYSVGFSGVLFAMKVVLNSQSDDYTYVHGVLVPTRFAAWAELILIQMFVPRVSFLGHLGGILAGLVYVNIKTAPSGSNRLTRVLKYLFHMVGWPIRFVWHLFGFGRRTFGRGRIGGSQTRGLSGVWRCRACTYDNPDWFNMCEMCGTEREEGHSSLGFTDQADEISIEELQHEDGNPSLRFTDQASEISLEELRRLRVQRFGR